MAGRVAWNGGYEGDEIALGIALALALHALPVVAILLRVYFPAPDVDEQPLVSQPVIGADLLKLGKPLDPKQLPDRLVPRARTAPHPKIVASREDPGHKSEPPDAGPPPPNTEESDIQRLIAKSDPFAEKTAKDRPEQGFANGSDAGLETDPNKVRAGDMYLLQLRGFFHDRWQIPTVISQGEVNKLCTKITIAIDPQMRIWFVQQNVAKASGNDLFDDSARSMLQKLEDDHTTLPEPPPEVAGTYRNQRIQISLGDGCR